MTNTPENRHAFETMARLANALNTGYQIFSRVTDNNEQVIMNVYSSPLFADDVECT